MGANKGLSRRWRWWGERYNTRCGLLDARCIEYLHPRTTDHSLIACIAPSALRPLVSTFFTHHTRFTMLANTLSLILAAAALTSANPPPADEECDVSYQDVTVTSVVTKVVEVQPTSSVYESPCPTSTVITSGDSTTTSYYTITSTLTSSYEITTTVDAPGDGPTDAPGDGPTDAPAPPSEYEPAPTSSKVAAPPYPVPGGNDTAPTGSSSVLLPTGTLTPPPPPGASCPAVWRTIGQEMMGAFAGCNRPARSSIRFAFHDAGKSSEGQIDSLHVIY